MFLRLRAKPSGNGQGEYLQATTAALFFRQGASIGLGSTGSNIWLLAFRPRQESGIGFLPDGGGEGWVGWI